MTLTCWLLEQAQRFFGCPRPCAPPEDAVDVDEFLVETINILRSEYKFVGHEARKRTEMFGPALAACPHITAADAAWFIAGKAVRDANQIYVPGPPKKGGRKPFKLRS